MLYNYTRRANESVPTDHHHQHVHAGAGREARFAPAVPPPSLLRLSAGARLVWAGALLAALWAAVAWALL